MQRSLPRATIVGRQRQKQRKRCKQWVKHTHQAKGNSIKSNRRIYRKREPVKIIFKTLIYLTDIVTEREREKETRRTSVPPIWVQLPKWLVGLGLARLNTGPSSLSPMCCILGLPLLLFRPLTGSWNRSGENGTWTHAHMGCWHHQQQFYTLQHNASKILRNFPKWLAAAEMNAK